MKDILKNLMTLIYAPCIVLSMAYIDIFFDKYSTTEVKQTPGDDIIYLIIALIWTIGFVYYIIKRLDNNQN